MLDYIKNNCSLNGVKKFFLIFFACFAFVMICRLFTSEALDYSRDLGYVASFSLLFTGLTFMWNNSKKHLILCAVFVGIYLLSAFVKLQGDMILMEREITHTIGFALILFSVLSFLYYTSQHCADKTVKNILSVVALISCVLFIMPALLFLGYAAVNGGIFSSDIMLTLFQTNPDEIAAYLKDKNLYLWAFGSVMIVAFVVLYICFACTLKSKKFNLIPYAFVLVWLSYCAYSIMPKLNLCFVVNVVQTTKATLNGFDDFKKSQQNRIAQLKNLLRMQLDSQSNGIYVLVIGESENKDHMNVYGYKRPTTPWLSEFAQNENTVVFERAYSNHTHTIPTLTYALSEKNQYNDIDLKDAFSIIEVAEAAGFKTYWLSNQSKYEVMGTPVTTMASLADEQHWLNMNTGDKIFTSYYDEKLVDVIPPADDNDKMLIVIHLMGSHGAYRDRYPKNFRHFYGSTRSIDTYDNSVLYTDYVLQKIYNKVRDYPNFMAWVYFSDHGDDADNELGHECTRFTYRMARIPFVVNVSAKFAGSRKQELENLKNNKNAYWSNDLLYDTFVRLIGVEGLPNLPEKYNLLSSEYDMPKESIRILHGEKDLSGEE